MICPHCNTDISDKLIGKHLASKGGKKSRRKLTPEDAKKMVAARELKRKENKWEEKENI